MAAQLVRRIHVAIASLDRAIAALFVRHPPEAPCFAYIDYVPQPQSESKSIRDILNDAFLFAVPKHRRTIEKRWKRKFGHPEYHMKLLLPKSTLRVCNTCGDDHEVGVLCPTCYKKVIDETKEMQAKIQEELKLEPVEKEVVVVYDGEKDIKPAEYFEGKRIVEMKKPRPEWFSKNLLQQTTQQPATIKDVKPSDLG